MPIEEKVFGGHSYKCRLKKKCLVGIRTNADWRKSVWWAFVLMPIGEKVLGKHSYRCRMKKKCLVSICTYDECRPNEK